MIQAIEEDERYRNLLAYVSEGNDAKVEQNMQYWKTELQAQPGADKGQMKVLECGIRWAVEARRKRKRRRARATAAGRASAELRTGAKQASQVRFGEEERLGETRAESTDVPEVTQAQEVQDSSKGMRGVGRTRPAGKAKERGNGGKGEHEGNGGVFGRKGKQQETREEEKERVRMAPNMGAGGSHP